MKTPLCAALLVLLLSLPNPSYSQLVNWVTETGLALGSTLVDGQVIPNFAGTGLTVTVNANVVGSSPFINASDPTKINIGSADACSVTLNVTGGTLDVFIENNVNLIPGEVITLSNANAQSITIQETASNGGARMTVDGVAMTGPLPSVIVEDATAIMTEQTEGAGTQWNASMSAITSFTWLYNFGTGPTGNEGFSLTILNSALPIELLDFEATSLDNQTVQIDWTTVSETNNDYFTVERSTNGIDWETLKQVAGAGHSYTTQHYHTIDQSPYDGNSYYRLKQTDFDGQYTYSAIEAVQVNSLTIPMLNIYPNPSKGQIHLEGHAHDLSSIRIYDYLGRELTRGVELTKISDTQSTADLSQLAAGLYYIQTQYSARMVYKQ